jgi:paraquat-inducible protein B
MSIQPARLGLQGDVTAENALNFLKERVSGGLRARLASGSLLTGGLKIELVDVDGPQSRTLIVLDNGLPLMPTTQSDVSDAAATVEGVFNRINSLPIEELLNSAISFLNAAETLVSNEDLRETPQDVRQLLADMRGLVGSDDVRNIPVALNATLSKLETFVADLEEQQLAARLVAALDTVATSAETVSSSVEGVPTLINDLSAVAKKAEALAVEDLLAEATALVDSAEKIIASEATAALPKALKEAVDQVNASLSELRAAGAVKAINETLASARTAAANAATSTEALPQITERLNKVLEDAAAATANINTAVEGGTVDNVNRTLASARTAAATVALTAQDLPQMVARLNRLFAQAGRTIEGYDKGEELSRSAQATLRDIQKAADALASLAKAIERNPNSLLLGR